MKKRIVLCADDYGQAPAISEGIIHLLKEERLSAVSCMVNGRYWPEHARWLAPFHQQADIGLHFNLTEGTPLSPTYQQKHGNKFLSVEKVLVRSFLRFYSQQAIEAELHAQIDKFEEMLGFLPDHIDGHQHIHQFPVIRDAIVSVYAKRLRTKNTYIRLITGNLTFSDIFRHFKKVIVHVAGSRAMEKLLVQKGIPHNQTFSGIYAFGFSASYPVFFPQFLQAVGDGGLIMCHPGLAGEKASDLISGARLMEYQYLAGGQFIEDCRVNKVAIKRFKCADNLL